MFCSMIWETICTQFLATLQIVFVMVSQISCMSTVEGNWFRCVSSRDCDAEIIKGLLKIFKNQIPMLLETIVNLVDSNVSRKVICNLPLKFV